MKKVAGRKKRHKVLRKKVIGSPERPRLCVSRSSKNISAQLINDYEGKTLFSLSTSTAEVKKNVPYGGNVKAAELLGEEFGRKAKEKGFIKVVFDRSGYLYHGRVKAFADGARKSGLAF
ncbi:50S ribosomal protein L18 [Candidatus Omnitrophota bacterium]